MDEPKLLPHDAVLPHDALLPHDAVPHGFRFAAVRAGLKASGNLDLACAVADQPAAAAAMFTSNRVVAAPILVGRRHLEQSSSLLRAVVVNAGNANCATGEDGIYAAQQVCAKAAEHLGCKPCEVLPSSTGIIGVPFPAEKLITALPDLIAAVGSSASHFEQMARAIMTTDTRPKLAHASFEIDGTPVRLAGMAKGAGMIHPQLQPATGNGSAPHATMLVYLFTDAAVNSAAVNSAPGPAALSPLLNAAVEESFNRISIDGDTSTNDTVLLLASGASGVTLGARDDHATTAFTRALNDVCLSLAKQIVADGEGIAHVVELNITGALTDSDALRIARSIAHSPLVKTAWAGNDPNWGRILAATGYAGVAIDPALLSVRFGELEICTRGCVSPAYDETAAHAYLTQREITVHVDVGVGQGACRFWTTDLTADYVRINADYST